MTAQGRVFLVGAGPGDPDLLTVRGLEVLQRAEVVLFDRLVTRQIVDKAPADAEKIDVGKRSGDWTNPQRLINRLLVDRARRGELVVRLKGGDPFLFGRGGEEVEACRAAGIRCTVVPGISSALAGPAAIGVPVTHRRVSRSVAIVTARGCGPGSEPDPSALAAIDTVVVLMGRARLADFARSLIAAGRDPMTPAACVSRATTPGQRSVTGVLGDIASKADLEGLEAPMVTVIGAVASMAQVFPLPSPLPVPLPSPLPLPVPLPLPSSEWGPFSRTGLGRNVPSEAHRAGRIVAQRFNAGLRGPLRVRVPSGTTQEILTVRWDSGADERKRRNG